jgi:hypothetical protein
LTISNGPITKPSHRSKSKARNEARGHRFEPRVLLIRLTPGAVSFGAFRAGGLWLQLHVPVGLADELGPTGDRGVRCGI